MRHVPCAHCPSTDAEVAPVAMNSRRLQPESYHQEQLEENPRINAGSFIIYGRSSRQGARRAMVSWVAQSAGSRNGQLHHAKVSCDPSFTARDVGGNVRGSRPLCLPAAVWHTITSGI